MRQLFQPLLFLLAGCSRNDLIKQIEFLKVENEMLRKRFKRVLLTPEEKSRLMKLGEAIGPTLRKFITIVRYDTYQEWVRKAKGGRKRKKMGRPRTAESLRNLIVKIAGETGWGYTRVMGEMKKLGIKPPSRDTVKRIMKEHEFDPGPKSGPDSWQEFLKRHKETLYQCDFFSKRIWTKFGLQQFFVLVFLHLGSRKVFVSKCTNQPTAAWMSEQADKFIEHTKAEGKPATFLYRDRDGVSSKGFDTKLREAGIEVRMNPPQSPNLQAHIERFIQSLQQEALDHFIVFGEKHFDFLISEYVEHYHTERPHQGLGNVVLSGTPPDVSEPPDVGDVVCRTRLGGLLKHYSRRAA